MTKTLTLALFLGAATPSAIGTSRGSKRARTNPNRLVERRAGWGKTLQRDGRGFRVFRGFPWLSQVRDALKPPIQTHRIYKHTTYMQRSHMRDYGTPGI